MDTHCYAGYVVPPFYDSLLAKLIVARRGPGRTARCRLCEAVDRFVVGGVATTIPFHRRSLDTPEFVSGDLHTRWVEESFRGSTAA